ncbi:MAG: flagellar biosynthetic protein FliR [Phycisphaerales bacterium]|nr:flagellar biosynthetic protein FliR [Phycisphaerales bacterium]
MTGMDAILSHTGPFALVFFRFTGLYLFSPVFGSNVIPRFIKLHLALALALVLYPTCPAAQQVGIELSIVTIGPLIAMEIMIGYVIGWLAGMPLVSMQMSGFVMGRQMGLGMATFYDPASNTTTNVIGQILFYLTLSIFLLVGGLEVMLAVLADSFSRVPLGGFRVDQSVVEMMAGVLMAAYTLAVRVAAPIYCIIFLQTLGIGFLSKTSPQLNIISFGFPMRVISGLVGLIASCGVMYVVVSEEVGRTLIMIGDWVFSLGSGGVSGG